MCGSSKWVLTPELMELPVHVVAGRQRAFYPSVMITCDICGLMLQIKSSSVGIDTNASKAERETAGANA